jgi:hypothetical protein
MPCIAAFFVSAVHCQGARQAGSQGFSLIAHQARLAPADTFISAGWACPTAPLRSRLHALPGLKAPEKQLPATNCSFNGIHG